MSFRFLKLSIWNLSEPILPIYFCWKHLKSQRKGQSVRHCMDSSKFCSRTHWLNRCNSSSYCFPFRNHVQCVQESYKYRSTGYSFEPNVLQHIGSFLFPENLVPKFPTQRIVHFAPHHSDYGNEHCSDQDDVHQSIHFTESNGTHIPCIVTGLPPMNCVNGISSDQTSPVWGFRWEKM